MTDSIDEIARSWLSSVIETPASGLAEYTPGDSAYELHSSAIDDPDLTWRCILQILQLCRVDERMKGDMSLTSKVIGLLGAGPVEDLLEYGGVYYTNLLLAAAESDSILSSALEFSDLVEAGPEVSERLEKFRNDRRT